MNKGLFIMNKVVDFIEGLELIEEGDFLTVGVSGGIDSMVLLDILSKYVLDKNIEMIVAHVNHGFRKESEEEFDFVKEACSQYGFKFKGCKLDVPTYQKERKLSEETAARELRYRFYKEVMEEFESNKLVLGHHGDDLVETVIMRQIKGSNGRGLVGMTPKKEEDYGIIIRPLLCVDKDDIYCYQGQYGIEYREDVSNFTDKYFRNRVRKNVLGHLKNENKKVHERFLNQSIRKNEEENYFDKIVEQTIDDIVEFDENEGYFKIYKEDFNELDICIKRRLITELLRRFGKTSLNHDILSELNDKTKKNDSGDFDELLKGIYIVNEYDAFYIFNTRSGYKEIEDIVLKEKQTYCVESAEINLKENKIYFDDEVIREINANQKVEIRNRKEGDRTKGGKKLKTLMSEKKLAMAFRKRLVFLVIDGLVEGLIHRGEYVEI